MAGNSELIDNIIDPKAVKQVKDLTKQLEDLEAQFVETTKQAIALNNATAKANTFKKIQTDANNAAIALEKLQQQQNKTAITQAQLNKAKQAEEAQTIRTTQAQERYNQQQQKAADAAKKALSPYQQLSKELDRLRASAKDIAIQFGTNSEEFKKASKNVQDLDGKLKGIDKTLGQSQRNVGNYASAFRGILSQYLPFGEGTLKISENLKTLGGDIEKDEESLGGLGAGFAEFTTATFVVAIASATYYLSQFKSTADKVSEIKGGLKNLFAALGEEVISGGGPNTANKEANAFSVGKATTKATIELQDKQQVEEIHNASLEAQTQYYRALSDDRTRDISDRVKYLKKAQEIEKEILESQKKTAEETIATALKVGFLNSSLSDKEISRQKGLLAYAASQGNFKVAQDLAKDGTKFTEAGLDLYQQGVKQIVQYQANAQNQIVQINADKNNKELRSDLAYAAAQNELRKAQLESEKLNAKLILEDVYSSNTQKLAANNDYVNKSIELIKLQEQEQLDAAGLGSTRGGRDTRTQATQRQAITQAAQNQITQIVADSQKTRQGIVKAEIDAELAYDKSRIAGIQATDEAIISNSNETYQRRLSANRDFIEQSIRLAKDQYNATIKSLNLPGNAKNDDATQRTQRATALSDYNNQIADIESKGAKERQSILTDYYNSVQKQLDDILKLNKDAADNTVTVLDDQNNAELQKLQQSQANKIRAKTDEYIKGKITQQDYNRDLLTIDDQYNIKRLEQEVKTDQAILAVRKSALQATINEINRQNPITVASVLGNPFSILDNISKIAEAKKNSGVSQASNKLSTDQLALGNAVSKSNIDDAQTARDKAIEHANEVAQAVGDIQILQNDASKILQANYQNEIDLLEQKKQVIQQNAQLEIDAVNGSIASEKTKQQEINLINAKAAIEQQKVTDQQNRLKTRQAEYEKALNIATIVQNTAVAITKTLAEGGFILGVPLVPVIAALGAAELAIAIATPLPKYEHGTTNAKGGPAIVSEKGREAVITPRGEFFLTPEKESIIDIPKGSEVIPTNKLMKMITSPQKLNFVGGQVTDMASVEKLLLDIKRNTKPQKGNNKMYFKMPGSTEWVAFERGKRR
jgi:hypothetical protein